MAISSMKAPWHIVLHLLLSTSTAQLRRDIVAENRLVEAFGIGKLWQSSLRRFHGLKPNAFSAAGALRAMEAVSHWRSSLQLAPGSPSLEAQTSALVALGLAGQWRRSLLGRFDLVAHNALLTGAARAVAWIQGLKRLELLRQQGFRADEITWSAGITAAEKGQEIGLRRCKRA